MKVLIFWNPKGYGPINTCTAIAWNDLNEWVNPLLFTPDKGQIEWLKKYNNPLFNPMVDRKQNAAILALNLGYWPTPLDSDQFSLVKNIKSFDDSINF